MTRKLLAFALVLPCAVGLASPPALAGKPAAKAPAKDVAKDTKEKAPAAAAAPSKDAKAPAAAKPAGPSSYEALRAAATAAGDLATLVEPLFATCTAKPGEDLSRRQCEQIRSWHLQRLKDRTWYAVADTIALQQQPYDATSKSLTLNINGCLQCTRPPVVGGAPRLIATRAPRGIEDGAPVGIDVGSHDVPFETADRASFWNTKVRPRLRVEFLFGVGQPFDDKTQKGVGIKLIGHRVFNMCTGDVLASDPPSPSGAKMKIAVRDPSCPAADAPSDEQIEIAKAEAALPDTISRGDVQKTMAPVQQRIYECGEEFELKQGVARVHVTVQPNGKVKMTIAEPYDKGDVHLCIRAALNEARFPVFKSSSPPVEIDYPFVLRR